MNSEALHGNATRWKCDNSINRAKSCPICARAIIQAGINNVIYAECERNKTGFVIFEYDKKTDDFGECGRREISNQLVNSLK